jgi:hypothetical protein
LKWPSHLTIGGALYTISAVERDFLLEHFDSDAAGVDLENRAIYYFVGSTGAEINNNLCHELAHILEYALLLSREEGYTEMEIQSLGNVLHQVVRAVVEENSDITVE